MVASAKVKLLIVDDETLLRTSLSQIFTALGYSVRSAEDGFSALLELRKETPDILLSDLNMPGMSGFELLSVVRRRFPAIQVIAMSGAFSADGIPLGVAADAFHEKGANPQILLETVKAMTHMEQWSPQNSRMPAPIWIPKNGHDPAGVEYVMITCPDCLRTFPQFLGKAMHPMRETGCIHCSGSIHYAIVEAENPPDAQLFLWSPGTEMPAPPGAP